jgi:PAS domain-containing protein
MATPNRELEENKRELARLQQRIAELQVSREALRASEERYRRLFEDSRDAIIITRLDRTVVEWW